MFSALFYFTICKEMYRYLILLQLPIFICYLDLEVISFYLLAADWLKNAYPAVNSSILSQ